MKIKSFIFCSAEIISTGLWNFKKKCFSKDLREIITFSVSLELKLIYFFKENYNLKILRTWGDYYLILGSSNGFLQELMTLMSALCLSVQLRQRIGYRSSALTNSKSTKSPHHKVTNIHNFHQSIANPFQMQTLQTKQYLICKQISATHVE